MASSHISGPSIVYGETGTDSNGEAGPSIFFQGYGIPDVRKPYGPGAIGRGRVVSLPMSGTFISVDAVPSASGPAKVAATQAATSGTALTLAGYSAGVAPNTPFVPASGPTAVQRVVALDPGFAQVTTTGGSAVLTNVPATVLPRLRIGNWLAVAGGAANAWMFVTVTAISTVANGVASVTVSSPMVTAGAATPLALTNHIDRNDSPSAVSNYFVAGADLMPDPKSGLARGVSVTSSAAGDTGWTVTVRGFDRYGYPLTEAITATAGGLAYGSKAFAWIGSVTPSKAGGGASTGTFSVGTSDLFGFSVRSDAYEFITAHWAGAGISGSTGYVAADLTTPATGATKDVRGSFQIGTNGPGAGASGGAPDGTKRLVIRHNLPPENLVQARVADPSPLFGVTQFSA